MYTLGEVIAFLDEELEVAGCRDYGTNGLQVEACETVSKVVCGVSANGELIDEAIRIGAELVVVHHGLFWGPGMSSVTGLAAARIAKLFRHGISLAGYHLPLDKHPRLGNNTGICDAMGLPLGREPFGEVKGQAIGLTATLPAPESLEQVLARITRGVCGGREPRFVFPYGPSEINKIGVCSGAASDLLAQAKQQGCEMYVTGELAERAEAEAKELGIHLVAAGHYATEVFGPQRIAKELSRVMPKLSSQFVDIPSAL